MSRRIGVPGLVVCLLLALSAPAAMAAGNDGPLPGRTNVPGYRASGTGAALGRSAFAGRLPSSARHAHALGAGFRGGGETITFGVVTTASAGKARAAVKALRHGRRAVALGGGIRGLLKDTSRRHKTDVAVVFAAGSELGAVRVRARSRLTDARATAVARAQSLLQRLRRLDAMTPLDRTLEGIRSDGSFSPQVALRAFALAYGPLPGVPGAPAPNGAELHATIAIGMVLRVWNQLSAAQQAAIDEDLGFTPPSSSGSVRSADRADGQVLTPDAAYTALADSIDAKYHALIPGLPPITIKVFRTSEKITSPKFGDAAADSAPVDASGQMTAGPMAYCRIRVPPAGQKYTGKDLATLLAHETFHCVEFALNPAGWQNEGYWEIEGLADWAAESVEPGSALTDSLVKYYATPQTPLFARDYDAVGFWGHADEVGGKGSLWAKLPPILNAPDPDDAYYDAGGISQEFQETWPSAAWRSGVGPTWNQSDPEVLPVKAAGTDNFYIDDDAGLHSDPYAMTEYVVAADPERPLVQVISTLGTMRAGTKTNDFGVVGTSDFYCAGTCTCPNGESSSSIPSHQDFSKLFVLALTGGSGVGIGGVTYHSLDEFCEPSPSNGLQVRRGSGVVATFKTGTCSAGSGGFHATAHDGAWRLDVRIKAFAGYSKRYMLAHSNDPVFVIDGPGGPYSNRYPSPNMSVAGGAISFYPGGTKMLLGYEYAWNAGASEAVFPLGKMTCTKPKKH